MGFDQTSTYVASRATLESWSADGDEDAAKWLEDYPNGAGFGVEDGAICVWFQTAKQGRAWLEEMRADSDMQGSIRRVGRGQTWR